MTMSHRIHCIYTLSIEESLVIIKLFKHFFFNWKGTEFEKTNTVSYLVLASSYVLFVFWTLADCK